MGSVTSSRGELIGGFFGKCVILTIILEENFSCNRPDY